MKLRTMLDHLSSVRGLTTEEKGESILIRIFIYLFVRRIHTPTTAKLTRINVKERDKKGRQVRRAKKKKWVEAQRVKPLTTSRGIDALIGNEEQNGKQKRNRERAPNPATLELSIIFCDLH